MPAFGNKIGMEKTGKDYTGDMVNISATSAKAI